MKLNRNRKLNTEKRAQATMLPLLEERLVRAEPTGLNSNFRARYGIIVPVHLIKTYSENGEDIRVEDCAWALWKDSREEAIEAYQNATEEILVPRPDGLLSFVNLREFQLEILDEPETTDNWTNDGELS